jgi:Lipopolysaccharide-assembly
MLRRLTFIFIIPLIFIALQGCGVYSFTGATIEGKTINIHVMENRAMNMVPTLASTLTDKIRSRILSQTGLAPVNSEATDYDISGLITGYNVTVSGVQNTQTATQNRLTINLEITFKNRLNEKAGFTQTFTRFADFPATQTLQSVENQLINDIGNQLADDIFNKAFVNW